MIQSFIFFLRWFLVFWVFGMTCLRNSCHFLFWYDKIFLVITYLQHPLKTFFYLYSLLGFISLTDDNDVWYLNFWNKMKFCLSILVWRNLSSYHLFTEPNKDFSYWCSHFLVCIPKKGLDFFHRCDTIFFPIIINKPNYRLFQSNFYCCCHWFWH